MQMATAEVLQEQILPRPVGVGGHAAVSEVSEEALGDSRHQASHAVGGDGGERSGSAMEIDQDRGTREQVAYGEQATVWADDAQVEYPRGGFHRSFAIEYVDEWSDGHGSADSYLSESGDFADTLDVTELEEQPLPGGSGAGIGRKRAWSVELQEGHSHRVPCAVDEGPSGGLSGGSECKRNRVISVVNSQVKEHGQTSRGKAGFDSPQGSEARHGEGGGRGSHIRTEGSAQGDGEVAEGGSAGREGIVGSKRWTCEGQDTWCCREQDEEDKSASDWECESDGDARLFADDETGSSSLRETCASPGAECGEAAARRSGAGFAGTETGIILHVDVDSFYCNVERIDDPSLEGVPIAVQQFNSGGFVAVSYEAQAKGIRKGDGVGAGGRAAARNGSERLKGLIGRVSLAEAKAKCPDLRVLPMRTDRYREIAGQLHELLAEYASQVEKASYDDFYLDCTAMLRQRPPNPAAAALCHARVRVLDEACVGAREDQGGVGARVGGKGTHQWCDALEEAPALLRAATNLSVEIQARVRERMGMSVSIGVACNKLQARLISGLNKPQGITVLPPAHVARFMAPVPLMSIPTMRGKGGAHVCRALAINTVGQLQQYTQSRLVSRFGEKLGCWLASLPMGGLWEDPKDRGRAKSLLAERSCPPTSCPEQCRELLGSLAWQLYQRLVDECRAHARRPNKLILSWRQNYENVRSKSARVPHQLTTALARIRAQAPSEARVITGTESSLAPASAAVAFGDGGGRTCEVTEENSDMIRGDVSIVKVLEDAAMDLLQVRRHHLSVLHRALRWLSAQLRASWASSMRALACRASLS
jgi:nucleotidyltransferase/DNA polymerase involved in DNA repair